MMMKDLDVLSYEKVGPCYFNKTSSVDFVDLFGKPLGSRFLKWGSQNLELHYEGVIARFEKESGLFCDITFFRDFLPSFSLNGVLFYREDDVLLKLCEMDSKPMEELGFVCFYSLGVMISDAERDGSFASINFCNKVPECNGDAKPFVYKDG